MTPDGVLFLTPIYVQTYRCKEISINTFQKPSSNVSASKFEIFVKNIFSAYIWVDSNVLGSEESF